MPMTPIYNQSLTITKSDTVDLAPFLAWGRLTDAVSLDAGDAVLVFQNNTTQIVTVPAGTSVILPVAVRRINSTNTTTTKMVALYQV